MGREGSMGEYHGGRAEFGIDGSRAVDHCKTILVLE